MLQSSKMRKINFRDIKSRIRIPRLNLPESQQTRKRLLLGIAGVAGMLFLVAFGYGFWYTSQPGFCVDCHEMKPAIRAWRTSLHSEVPCNTCHAYGVISSLKQKTTLVGEAYRHFTKSYDPQLNRDSELSKKIDNDGCLQCHTPKRIITPRKSLLMNHNIHLEKGVNCTTCHNRAGHPSSSGYKDFISMDGCFRCHGLSKTALAPGRCDACHPTDKKVFDLVPLSHKIGTWKTPDHGKIAKQDTSTCFMCHKKTFCRGCHGVEVPHPEKFVKAEHGSLGNKNPQVCRNCHREKDFCNACHHKGYNERSGGWVPTHKNIVAVAGPAVCFICHGPTYCAWCHVRGVKQPLSERLTKQ
ncbi:MAG TPA: hypothetical protein DE036_00545 [Actinobacteria bacterium]|nr:hypothetical protein [Actinomycetota bacterium]